jgi:hypothetical protein
MYQKFMRHVGHCLKLRSLVDLHNGSAASSVLYGLTAFTLFGLILLLSVLTLNISRQVLKCHYTALS